METREPGCGDNSCVFSCIRSSGGMGTNGGCRCFKNLELNTDIISAIDGTPVPYNNKEEIRHLQRSVMMLARAYLDLKKGNAPKVVEWKQRGQQKCWRALLDDAQILETFFDPRENRWWWRVGADMKCGYASSLEEAKEFAEVAAVRNRKLISYSKTKGKA